jgi:hypothetical protein
MQEKPPDEKGRPAGGALPISTSDQQAEISAHETGAQRTAYDDGGAL